MKTTEEDAKRPNGESRRSRRSPISRLPSLPTNDALVRAACWLGLVALPLMVTSVFVPTVWPVLVALSVGQALGTMSFALYLVAVIRVT